MTELPETLVAAVAGRYDLERVLGRGGMATVYLARDVKHGRQVALKVLRPDLAASIGADRFLKEIEIAARLTHPHVLALHDSGESGGFLYYVMPYIAGASLRQRLERDGRLTFDAALGIASSVADALTYAHRMGVLHRDIKPENILFAEGHPIVGDFGIAKAISTAGGEQLTRTGFPLGTPGYMSPEQAAGLTDLDERTDVYGLAVVIYEMMVGQVPGRWPTEDAVRAGRFIDAPSQHRRVLDQHPGHVEAALVRGLAIRLDQRTPSPAGLIGDLTTPRSRRRYSEEEVRSLIQRAAELEVSQPTTVDGALTIGGIERVAAEAGIDPARVREAAVAPVSAPHDSAPPPMNAFASGLIGGPTYIAVERWVEGEVPETEFQVMVEEIRMTLGNVGAVGALGRSFTWSLTGSSSGRATEVTVSVRAGRTRIYIRDNLGDLKGGVFGGILGGLGGGGLGPIIAGTMRTLQDPAVLLFVVPAWLATVYAGCTTTYHYLSRGRRAKFEALADRLASLAREVAVVGRMPGEARGVLNP